MAESFSLGVVGYPVDHSLSPRIHKAALRDLGLKGEYDLYPVPPLPEGEQALDQLLDRVRQGDLSGLNVTIPHKQSVTSKLDALAAAAQAIGAVNTISRKQDQLVGDNTDSPGFLADLNRLGWSVLKDDTLHALVLGAGGSARAVTYALARAGWNVTVAARKLRAAQDLAGAIQFNVGKTRPTGGPDPVSAIHLDKPGLNILAPSPRLIINATPLGMHPYEDQCPWPLEVPFPPAAAVYDLVYNPPETCLMKAAREAGLRASNGLGMLVEQAALSFTIWTGRTAPRDAMMAAVKDHLNDVK
jgi:shikimate dehydrogenase